jgi:hypothetical protein
LGNLVAIIVASDFRSNEPPEAQDSFQPSSFIFQSEQIHDPLGQALLAQHDVQLAANGYHLHQLPEPRSAITNQLLHAELGRLIV